MTAPRSRSELALVPEALTLEILDAALAAAENALAVVYPELDEIGASYPSRAPPSSVMIAALLVPRLAEMRALLAWYRVASRPAESPSLHDDPF